MIFRLLTAVICLLPVGGSGADIRFYGDLMLSRGMGKFAVERHGQESIRIALSPFLSHAAIHVVNLEGVMSSDGYKSRHDTSLCFRIAPPLMDLLAGFQVVSLENNHALDEGPLALKKTAGNLDAMNVVPLYGSENSSVIQTDNGNVGIIAATDVFNDKNDRSSVMADSPELLRQIRRLREICTAVAVYVHWSRELLPIATASMERLATTYFKAGADLVVGTHTHVVGPVTVIEGKPVAYSLGNFLFDQKYPDTKKGSVLAMGINEEAQLSFKLFACETPMNSLLSALSTAVSFVEENKILSCCTRTIQRVWTGTFTADHREKRLSLSPATGGKALWQVELRDRETAKRESVTPAMPVRKLQPVDVNNDGIDEVMLIQEIYSKFDNETAKRVYIYSFDSGFHALWRGTALSRPLLDATFVRTPGGPILAALHSKDSFIVRNTNCKERVVTLYRWNGFGFSGVKEMPVEDECTAVSCVKDRLQVVKNGVVGSIIDVAETLRTSMGISRYQK